MYSKKHLSFIAIRSMMVAEFTIKKDTRVPIASHSTSRRYIVWITVCVFSIRFFIKISKKHEKNTA